MALTFGTPPPFSKNSKGRYIEDADELRRHPGQWAELDVSHLAPTSVNAMATHIRKGRVAGFDAGDFDAMYRKGQLWVRYIGGEK